MAQDSFILADTATLHGAISTDNGNFKTDGTNGNVTAVGTLTASSLSSAQQTGTVTTLVNSNTITPGTSGGSGSVRVTAAGAVTGLIIAAGTKAGQLFTVIHEGAAGNTLTMAASGTSNVANGVSCVITGPSARTFVWDSVTSLWYQCA